MSAESVHFPFLNKDVVVGGAIYDVTTGKITPVEC